MRIQSFIGASSAMLIAWLGATYLQRVPSERYRQHGGPTPVAGMGFGMETEMVADNETLGR